MADNSTQTLGPVTVWALVAPAGDGSQTTTPNNAYFPWGWAWIKQPSLIVTGCTLTQRPSAMGSGTLRVLRDQRQEPASKIIQNFNSQLVSRPRSPMHIR